VTSGGVDVTAVTYSHDGRWLLATSDQGVRVRDLETGKVRDYRGHEGPALDVAADHEAGLLVSTGRDGHAAVWDLRRPGSPPRRLPMAGNSVLAVAIHTGRRLLAVAAAGDLGIWSYPKGDPIPKARFEFPGVYIWDLAFSHTGTSLAVCGSAGLVTLWSVDNEREIRRFEGHTATVRSIDFSPRGRRIVSAGDDALIIWDVATGRALARIEGRFRTARFSPNGKRVLTNATSTNAQFLDLEPLEWPAHESLKRVSAITRLRFRDDRIVPMPTNRLVPAR